MKKEDLLRFKEKYQNKWVARSSETREVLGSHKSLKKLALELDKSNLDYTVEKILPLNRAFIP